MDHIHMDGEHVIDRDGIDQLFDLATEFRAGSTINRWQFIQNELLITGGSIDIFFPKMNDQVKHGFQRSIPKEQSTLSIGEEDSKSILPAKVFVDRHFECTDVQQCEINWNQMQTCARNQGQTSIEHNFSVVLHFECRLMGIADRPG